MDSAPDSPDQLQRAASSEPSSTRPNPFDDSDAARKRRRTSLSGSPSRSRHSSHVPDDNSSTTTTLNGDDQPESGSAMIIDDRTAEPQTPDLASGSGDPPLDPPSSKVTLSLRKHQRSDNHPDNMSITPPSPSSPLEGVAQQDQDAVDELANIRVDTVDPVELSGSSSSASDSPPVELVRISDDENDVHFDMPVTEVPMSGRQRQSLADPMEAFPYHEPANETRCDTVHRLINYISVTPTLDDNVIFSTQRWLQAYLNFLLRAGRRTELSLRANRKMLLAYPAVITAMGSRTPPLHLEPRYHDLILSFFADFAQLTAHLVERDIASITRFQQQPPTNENRCPELFCAPYLHHLYILTRPATSNDDNQVLITSDVSGSQTDDTSFALNKFQSCLGGNPGRLGELAGLLIDLPPISSPLLNTLAHLSEILSVLIQAAYRRRHEPQVEEESDLERGHQICNNIAACVTKLIDQHVTQLGIGGVSCMTSALTSAFQTCLKGHHKLAKDRVEDFQHQYPELPADLVPEAIAFEWRLDVLGKLIRSSQMQLRVMAATNICGDLLGLWNRYKDGPNHPQLKHIAEYLLRSNLIEYVFGPNCHPEIKVQSANIVGFLLATKTFQRQHTDRLWQSIITSQDPRVSGALVQMVNDFSNLLDYAEMYDLCEHFQTLAFEYFTPVVLRLLTIILGQLFEKAKGDQKMVRYQPYDLCLRLLRESSICAKGSQIAHPEIHRTATDRLRELLCLGIDRADRARLYETCLEDIAKKANTSLGSLWGLLIAIRPSLQHDIKSLTEDRGLARLIVDELENAAEAGQTAGAPAILYGSTNQPRRDFISILIRLQPEALIDRVLAKTLWDHLVGPRSSCLEDREAGWDILNSIVKGSQVDNAFISTCLKHHLPSLNSTCFCPGMLEFVRKEALFLVDQARDVHLDDDNTVKSSCLEQLWKIILQAADSALADQAIHILAVEIYMSNSLLSTYSYRRTRQVHSILVNRCFLQMKEAARVIKATTDGTSSGEEDSMVLVASEDQILEQEQTFARSLKLLRYFLDVYQTKPLLAAPDLRTLVCRTSPDIEGELVDLKYQSFDGTQQTEVRSLNIGRLNTAASLLARISQETGFENYRAFYRGQRFMPDEQQVCKSLEDLQIHNGLILVKRDEGEDDIGSSNIRPGSSALQIEILGHFKDMWNYLSMEENLAREIYDFLSKLPAHPSVMESFEEQSAVHTDIFPPGQPFKALYAVHALSEYKALACRAEAAVANSSSFPQRSKEKARNKSICLIVQAISDHHKLSQHSTQLQMQLTSSLMQTLVEWLQETDLSTTQSEVASFGISTPGTFVGILSDAIGSADQTGSHLVFRILEALLWLGLMDVKFWEGLISDQIFLAAIRRLLLDSAKPVREMLARTVKEFIIRENDISSRDLHHVARFFWSVVSQLIPDAAIRPDHCHEVFELSHFLVTEATIRWRHELDLKALTIQLSGLLIAHVSSEDICQVEPADPVARSLSSLFLLCLDGDKSIAVSAALPKDLVNKIFWRHLFPSTCNIEQTVPRVILNTETRIKLWSIIFQLSAHNGQKFCRLLQHLNELVPYSTLEDDEPYLYDIPFNFERRTVIRAACRYMGLRNLSNTCYLNSLLQQLYMNPGFRAFVMSLRLNDVKRAQPLLFATQKLFAFMQESYHRSGDPIDVVASIKTYEDTLIDIHNQMDVDEFYNLLFDRWEGQLSTRNEKNQLREFYGGKLVQQVKSKECEHISERLEPFSAIQCDIKGKSDLQESLQAYVDGEVLEGDNKYKCSSCDRHVDAVKRACLKDLPDHMIFHLKRFDFDLRTMQRSKINDHFSFPNEIDLNPYTVEYLSDQTKDQEDIFELVGVLVHSGTAESGHYYSYIRERPSRSEHTNWFEFNDENVSPWDASLMEAATFGGPGYSLDGVMQDKPNSAYMLFYQRASSLKQQQEAMPQQGTSMPLHVGINSQQKEHICLDNAQLLRRHCLFDRSHAPFVQKCFDHARKLDEVEATNSNHMPDSNGTDDDDLPPQKIMSVLAMDMVLSHLDQVVVRKKDLPDVDSFYNMIADAISQNPRFAFLFYEYFHKRPNALRSLLQRNPDPDVRRFSQDCFIAALKKTREEMPALYFPTAAHDSTFQDAGHNNGQDFHLARRSISLPEDCVLEGAMKVLNRLWKGFPVYIRAWDDLFKTFYGFGQLGSREAIFLLAHDYLEKLCRIITADPSADQHTSYAKMLQNIMRRMNGQMPSYGWIIAVIELLLEQLDPDLGPNSIVETPAERLDKQWTSKEVAIFSSHPTKRGASHFMEKLIEIDQVRDITTRILLRLMRASVVMDSHLLGALQFKIPRDNTSQSLEPFLRTAVMYLENTQYPNHANTLATYIARHARYLHVSQLPALIYFFRRTLSLRRPEVNLVAQVHDCCFGFIQEWAPYLLVHPLARVRSDAVRLVEQELLTYAPNWNFGENQELKRQLVLTTAQSLALACFDLLRDPYIVLGMPISREQASCVAEVASSCGSTFDTGLGVAEERVAYYENIRDDVIDQVRRYLTEQERVDEDDSDWDGGSVGSSEAAMEIADTHMHVMNNNDVNDT